MTALVTISRIRPRSIAALLLAACGVANAQTAQTAQTPDGTIALRTRSLAAQCAQCHGTDGRALPGAEVPGLAGLQATYIAEQMKAFRSGSRASSVMQQLAKGFSDAQVDQLARYFASQPAGGKP
jgi:cytochrome subunit of sulfide dehydrogenase